MIIKNKDLILYGESNTKYNYNYRNIDIMFLFDKISITKNNFIITQYLTTYRYMLHI